MRQAVEQPAALFAQVQLYNWQCSVTNHNQPKDGTMSVKISRGHKRCPECKRICGARLNKCVCGHVFNQKRKTLWAIFEEIGNQTTIPEVQKRYKRTTGNELATAEVSRLRKEWTEAQGKLPPRDCRTLQDVPRRNMLRDDKVSQPVFDKLVAHLDGYGVSYDDFVQAVKSFHSIPQLVEATQVAAKLRLVVKRAA